MKLIGFSIFFCLIINTVFGQKIYKSEVLKKGIYASIDEMLNNTPSIPLEFKVQEIVWQTKGRKKDTILSYSLIVPNKSVMNLENIVGFCDGNDVYFKGEGMPFNYVMEKKIRNSDSLEGQFLKIKHLNHLAYYIGYNYSDFKNPFSGRILNLETGELTYVSEKSMQYLLRNNKDLLFKFNNEDKKNRRDQQVLERYYLKLISSIK